MNDDIEINIAQLLDVKSPIEKIDGPYKVIIIYPNDCWGIAALKFDGKQCFGIRWFDTTLGTPNSFGKKTWFILPDMVANGIIDTFSFNAQTKLKLRKFLANKDETDGPDLSDIPTLVIDEVEV